MKKYDYSFLSNIPSETYSLLIKIDFLKRFKNININGEIKNKSIVNPHHNEKENECTSLTLKYIKNNYEELDFNKDSIFKIHYLLYKDINPSIAGKYKTIYKKGINRKIFNINIRDYRINFIKLDDIDDQINELIKNYEENKEKIEPLLLIPTLIFDFIYIHPFVDGNGRVSRILLDLLLIKYGYDLFKDISLTNYIEEYKKGYAKSLLKSSKKYYKNKNNYYYFINYFLKIVYKAYLDNTK